MLDLLEWINSFGFLGILLATAMIIGIPVIILACLLGTSEPARCPIKMGRISQCERNAGHEPPCGIGFSAMHREMMYVLENPESPGRSE